MLQLCQFTAFYCYCYCCLTLFGGVWCLDFSHRICLITVVTKKLHCIAPLVCADSVLIVKAGQCSFGNNASYSLFHRCCARELTCPNCPSCPIQYFIPRQLHLRPSSSRLNSHFPIYTPGTWYLYAPGTYMHLAPGTYMHLVKAIQP